MFSDKHSVGQLTALLQAHSLRDIVVCPGSRNAPIVHNLHECGAAFRLHPLTDERSAAFVALGLALGSGRPAAVCVTSGSALLACLPAVAEAYYQHAPLLVISADRPEAWIGQGDGQTLPQRGALQPYCPTAQIAECAESDKEGLWCANRRINEALLRLLGPMPAPSHINMALSEPLFRFSAPPPARERVVRRSAPCASMPLPSEVIKAYQQAKCPLIVVGQTSEDLCEPLTVLASGGHALVMADVLACPSLCQPLTSYQQHYADVPLHPDFVLHVGGAFTGKQLKRRLRQDAGSFPLVRVGLEGDIIDTFQHLTLSLLSPPLCALRQLAALPAEPSQQVEALREELSAYYRADQQQEDTEHPLLSQLWQALRTASCSRTDPSLVLHLANSSSLRLAARHIGGLPLKVFCNRGVNGIEGSLSTAVGQAMALGPQTLLLCIIGDLSFFYDQNALWNRQLPASLRIVLLNNGRGEIFYSLPGLDASPALHDYIAAPHSLSARGVCQTYNLQYLPASNASELQEALPLLFSPHLPGAALLEITHF